jgi:hypothetical protein
MGEVLRDDDAALYAPRALSPFEQVVNEILELHKRKGADYGTNEDIFANIRASERFGIPAWLGAVLRANDKMSRIQAFAVKGNLKNEPITDSILDLAVYAIIALVLWREADAKEAKTNEA